MEMTVATEAPDVAQDMTEDELKEVSGGEAVEYATQAARDLIERIDHQNAVVVAPSTDEERVVVYDEAIDADAMAAIANSRFNTYLRTSTDAHMTHVAAWRNKPSWV